MATPDTPDTPRVMYPVTEEHVRWAIELERDMGHISAEEAESRLAALAAQVREGQRG